MFKRIALFLSVIFIFSVFISMLPEPAFGIRYGVNVNIGRIRIKKNFDYDKKMEVYFIVKLKETGRSFAGYDHVLGERRHPAAGRWFAVDKYKYWIGPGFNFSLNYIPMQMDVVIEVWEDDYGRDDLIDRNTITVIKGRKISEVRSNSSIWYRYTIDARW